MIQNEYGKLKSCIVGREFAFHKKLFDMSFKIFFQKNLESIDMLDEIPEMVNPDVYNERNEDLDNLAKIISTYGVKVYRPEKVEKFIQIKTPFFSSLYRSSSNVRDQCLIYKNTIYETSPSITGRYFENVGLYKIFDHFYRKGYNWIQCPKSNLTDESIDKAPWDKERDYTQVPQQYEMFFDAANCLKINDDILYNYSSYNHYLGIKWLKKNINANIIPIRLTDNHIDGNIISLNEYTFLINDKGYKNVESLLPNKYKDFKFLRLNNDVLMEQEITDDDFALASKEGMSINVFSLDSKTVLVNKYDYFVSELLDKNGFNVIPVQLRHSRLFGGGLHCSTLDIDREIE